MGLKLNGANAGSVELASPDNVTGGDISLTLPNGVGSAGQYLRNSGTAGTLEFGDFGGPAFRAHIDTSSPPSFAHNSVTTIPFTQESFDTDDCFDTTTYRFTPTTAGYYQVNACVNIAILTNKSIYGQIGIRKNGITLGLTDTYENNSQSGRMAITFSDIFSMNGTTDYIEAYMYYYNYTDLTGSAACTANLSTLFSASLVRSL